MSIQGRAPSASDLIPLIAINLDPDIVTADEGKFGWYDIATDKFYLYESIDPDTVINSISGILREVTTEGGGGPDGVGSVVAKGKVPFAGCNVGEVYFVGIDGLPRVGPPDEQDGVSIRIGFCYSDGFLTVDLDPTSVQVGALEAGLNPETIAEYGVDDIWAGTTAYANSTDYGFDDVWNANPDVLFDSDYGNGDDNWGVLIA